MIGFKLSKAPISIKFLVTSVFCLIGLSYVALLGHIYIDTEMKPSLIIEAYSMFEYIELVDISVKFTPYYALYIFGPVIFVFMFTSYSEKLKRFFAVVPFLLIIVDISSMWAIAYVKTWFAYVLWAAGTCLGCSLLALILLTMYDVWLRKSS